MPVIFNTTNSGHSRGNAMIGRFETPIKAIIMHESDVCSKNDDIVKALFNVSRSNKFGESVVMQNEFDIFAPTAEGAEAPSVTYRETASKFIRHTTFKSQFRITREMMEDSQINQIAAKAENFTRSYYRTRNLFATKLLTGATAGADGTGTTVTFGPAGATQTFDITTADGVPLFSAAHTASPNRFHAVSGAGVTPAMVESVISAAVSKVRNMRDENGYPMGYTADTIVIPCDDPALESAVKKVLGSEFLGGEGGMLSGSINLHYGNWNLIIDPLWQRSVATSHPMIIFSSAARRNLQAAMFFDRTPLDVSDFVDEATLDYMWTGYARMSAGFVTHKWGCLVDILDSGTTALFDGAASGEGGAATAQSAVLTL